MWDGREMIRRLNADLLESANSSFVSDYLGYRYIYEAATNWSLRTKSLRQTQAITTVADDDTYLLRSDFLNIYTEVEGKRYIQYNNGTTSYFPTERNYEDIIHQTSRASVSVPGYFSIIDNPTIGSSISGTATSAGDASNGESTLTDSTASFSNSVSVGDVVHNITDNNAYGIVISVTSDTQLLVAMFGGTDNEWDVSDSYVITPQGRMQLVLDPPPSTAGHTITIYYLARPTPVFSPYRTYRVQSQFIPEILREAKALYEFRGKDYPTGSADMGIYERGVSRGNINYDKVFNRGKFGVNLKRG